MKRKIIFCLCVILSFVFSITTFALEDNIVDQTDKWYDVNSEFIYSNNDIIGTYKTIKDIDKYSYYIKIETDKIELLSSENDITVTCFIESESNSNSIKINNGYSSSSDYSTYCKVETKPKYNVCKFTLGLEFKNKIMSTENCNISVILTVNGVSYSVVNNDDFDLSVHRVITTTKPTTTKAPTTAKQTTTKAPTTAKQTTIKAPTTAKQVTTKVLTLPKETKLKQTTTKSKHTLSSVSSSDSTVQENVSNHNKSTVLSEQLEFKDNKISNATKVGIIIGVISAIIGISAVCYGVFRRKNNDKL